MMVEIKHVLNSRLHSAEERNGDLDNRSKEIVQCNPGRQ